MMQWMSVHLERFSLLLCVYAYLGTPMIRQPTLAQRDLDLFRLYHLVKDNGGMDKVTQELKWRSLYLQLGMPAYPTASHLIRQAYKR